MERASLVSLLARCSILRDAMPFSRDNVGCCRERDIKVAMFRVRLGQLERDRLLRSRLYWRKKGALEESGNDIDELHDQSWNFARTRPPFGAERSKPLAWCNFSRTAVGELSNFR